MRTALVIVDLIVPVVGLELMAYPLRDRTLHIKTFSSHLTLDAGPHNDMLSVFHPQATEWYGELDAIRRGLGRAGARQNSSVQCQSIAISDCRMSVHRVGVAAIFILLTFLLLRPDPFLDAKDDVIGTREQGDFNKP